MSILVLKLMGKFRCFATIFSGIFPHWNGSTFASLNSQTMIRSCFCNYFKEYYSFSCIALRRIMKMFKYKTMALVKSQIKIVFSWFKILANKTHVFMGNFIKFYFIAEKRYNYFSVCFLHASIDWHEFKTYLLDLFFSCLESMRFLI